MGYTGNNGTSDVDYATSIDERQQVPPTNPGAFRGGAQYGTAYADFVQSYDPINSYQQGSAGGSYTVQAGDTLASIAATLWGDASLWYKLAEVNGMSANGSLFDGQVLLVPSGVNKSTHNAGTFKPYDPAEAIGDTSPTTPKPPKRNKCGVFGAIISTVVAVAATFAFGPLGGNLVSQGFNNLIGLQHGFSWKSLGMSVLSAGVQIGVGELAQGLSASANTALNSIGKFLSGGTVGGQIATGLLANGATQGIAIAMKMQTRFDFAGAAAAGVGAGVSSAVSGAFKSPTTQAGLFGQVLATHTAGGIAGAAASSLVSGTSFGDNVIATLPSIIGQTVGTLMSLHFERPRGQRASQRDDPDGGTVSNAPQAGDVVEVEAGQNTSADTASEVHAIAGNTSEAGTAAAVSRPESGSASDPLRAASDSKPAIDLQAYGYNPTRPATIADNQRMATASKAATMQRTDISAEEKQKIVEQIDRNKEYWDSELLIASAMGLATWALSNISVTFSSGSLAIGGLNVATITKDNINILGFDLMSNSDGKYNFLNRTLSIENGTITLGGDRGVNVTRDSLSIGGADGLRVDNQGITIGGEHGFVLEKDRIEILDQAIWEDADSALMPRVNVADEFVVSKSGGGVQYRYMNPDFHGLIMHLDKDGILGLDVRAGWDVSKYGSGTDMVLSGLQRIEADGLQVNGIRGYWVSGSDSVNYAEFTKNLSTMSPQAAAANTWTGRLAGRLGYTQVSNPETTFGNVSVIFRKPK